MNRIYVTMNINLKFKVIKNTKKCVVLKIFNFALVKKIWMMNIYNKQAK
jgi:hypothetical protein